MTLGDVLTRLLLPVARLALARGLGVRDVTDPLKRAFLIAAQSEVDGPITDSRLALRTGLQRRDVARLRDQTSARAPTPVPARALLQWPEGVEVLPRSGPAPSFEALAREISRDVHPRSLLDALAQAGAVTVDGDNVRLLRRAFVPPGGSAAQMAYLADTLHDHGTAAVANTTADGAFFDRAAHFSGLTQNEVAALEAHFRARQMECLQDIADRARAMPGGGTCHLRFGAYTYWEDET